jgi:beta-ureidopropionase / N-carbamoyl-L-amino-acid hydrolase
MQLRGGRFPPFHGLYVLPERYFILLKVNVKRLAETFVQIRRLAGKSDRLNADERSSHDRLARDLFMYWCQGAGCNIHVDGFGNIFAIRAGASGHCYDAVMLGGFWETESNGWSDSLCGALAGLEIIRALNEAEISTDRALVVACWKSEGGARFYAGYAGVSHYLKNRSGFDAQTEMEQRFFAQEGPLPALSGDDRAAIQPGIYLGLHLNGDTGAKGDAADLVVADRAHGAVLFDVRIEANDARAGARHNAFLAMVNFVDLLHKFTRNLDRDVVFDVGNVSMSPDSINRVPRRVGFSIGVRHGTQRVLEAVGHQLVVFAGKVIAGDCFSVRVRKTLYVPPVGFSSYVIGGLDRAARCEGVCVVKTDGAVSHDASLMSSVCHAGAIFLPGRGMEDSAEDCDQRNRMKSALNVVLRSVVGFC